MCSSTNPGISEQNEDEELRKATKQWEINKKRKVEDSKEDTYNMKAVREILSCVAG